VLAHHSQAIHRVIFSSDGSSQGGCSPRTRTSSSSTAIAAGACIVTCSDDMTVGVVRILPNGSLLLAKLLHGHVSRVRAIDVQAGNVLSGELFKLSHVKFRICKMR